MSAARCQLCGSTRWLVRGRWAPSDSYCRSSAWCNWRCRRALGVPIGLCKKLLDAELEAERGGARRAA